MCERRSKKINNYFELKDVCRKATSYFIGSFMLELLVRQDEWKNPKTKNEFIKTFHQEYFAWDDNSSLEKTRNKVNCAIRIIESHMVEDALGYVINSNPLKMDIPEAKENAEYTLSLIKNKELKY